MPTLSTYQNDNPVKLLLIGDSGMGKTGALASLAPKYKIRMLDFDNGVEPLASYTPKEYLENVEYVTLTDKMKSAGLKITPAGTPTAFSRGLNLLTEWKYSYKDPSGEEIKVDLGKPSDWGPDTILVIDSLSHMSVTAMRRILFLNGRAGDQPYQSDWGDAMRQIEDTLALLYSDSIKCHVIILAHITYIGREEDGPSGKPGDKIITDERGYPNTLGKKLPPKVGTYFNTILQMDKQGAGAAEKRIIRTVSQGDIVVKNPVAGLPATLPIETGLAKFFEARTAQSQKKG